MFSMRVSDRMMYYFSTQLKGHFLVEYMPTSDQHSIPYRDGTSEKFTSPGEETPSVIEKSQEPYARNTKTGLKHRIVAVTDEKTGGGDLGLEQKGLL